MKFKLNNANKIVLALIFTLAGGLIFLGVRMLQVLRARSLTEPKT